MSEHKLKYEKYSDLQIEVALDLHVKNERETLLHILALIKISDERKLYLKRGHGKLKFWLIERFGYSATAAQRRIDAALIEDAVPGVAQKIQKGSVNLSTLCLAQSAIRAEEMRTRAKVTEKQKAELIDKIQNQSGFEVQQTLKAEFPEAQLFPTEKVTVANAEEIKIQVVFSKSEYDELIRAKELLSHVVPSGSLGRILSHVTKDFVKRKDPLLKKSVPLKEADDLQDLETMKASGRVKNSFHQSAPEDNDEVCNSKKCTDLQIFATMNNFGPMEISNDNLTPGAKDGFCNIKGANSSLNPRAQEVFCNVKESDEMLNSRDKAAFNTDNRKIDSNGQVGKIQRNNCQQSFSEKQTAAVPPSVEKSDSMTNIDPVSAKTRRLIFQRDGGACQYLDPVSKRRCGSRIQVEVDHIRPRSLGGSNHPRNLRCCCRAHNQWRAQRTFGDRAERAANLY